MDYTIKVTIAHAKTLVIKENEIKNLLKQSIPFIGQRLRVLLILKQNEKEGISNKFYNSLQDVEYFITDVVKATSNKEVMSI